MRIGIVIGRIGGIDGVALETEKWIDVLDRMGHEVHILTGEIEGPIRAAYRIVRELAFSHPATMKAQELAFFGKPIKEKAFLDALEAQADALVGKMERWIEEEEIECLLSENASALPFHLTMGMALRKVFEKTGLPVVTHDHDFAWERGDRYKSPFAGIEKIISKCFPVKLPNVRHAVINSAARKSLVDKFGITGSVVVPNVMDFDEPIGARDEYNGDLWEALGLGANDLLLFQITRIVRRKGIEIAIDLVHRLADPRVKLIITGTSGDDRNDTYTGELRARARLLGLEDQVLFLGHRFDNKRGTTANGEKIYTISDAYAHATACTYFSLYEGFGNAFVEAVAAKVPIFVNNYEPVYWPDIGSKGFKTVMIEKGELTQESVDAVSKILVDDKLQRRMANQNFELGREHFSYDALEQLLLGLFPSPEELL